MGELTGTWTIAPTTVAEAAAGDPDALARIVRAHHDDMARVCFVICGDADLAQDAVQAAWPRAWRKLGTLRDPSRLRPWLVSIAANEARTQLRRRSGRVTELAIDDVVASAPDPAMNAALLDLADAMRRLDRRRPRPAGVALRRRLRLYRAGTGARDVAVWCADASRPAARPPSNGARR